MAADVLYSSVSIEDLKLEKGRPSPLDLYVFLHASGRHHPLVKKGEAINETHWSNIVRLQGANLFVRAEDLSAWRSTQAPSPKEILSAMKTPAFKGEVLGEEAKEQLHKVYESLLTANVPKGALAETLAGLSENLLETLVPETKDAKSMILHQLRHIHLMNHSAAISSLAILVALANGFESRTAFSNLSFACLLMDAGLVDLSEKEMNTYYRNRSELPSHVMDRVRLHPLKSTQMLQGVKEVNESVQQLILVHQELHNGKGYHRGIRTGNVSPLARNLSFAVDLYEHIKGAELRGDKVSLAQAIALLSEKNILIHDRRHGADISTKLCEYLGLQA
jgi:HD-GYP domain-containing protein (c-di-GMP phosphodiesterase class II)